MALKDTTKTMEHLLEAITKDMAKAMNGNKAACQRVRVNTIKLEKVSKVFRKESVQAEKKGLIKKKPAAKPAKKAAAKKPGKKAAKPVKKAAAKKPAKRKK